MSDLISRAAAINELGDLFTLCRESMPNENGKHYVTEEELCIFYMRLANISAVDAVPVVHGQWTVTTERFTPELICSVCNERFPCIAGCCIEAKLHYCPTCGAKMDGERREEHG